MQPHYPLKSFLWAVLSVVLLALLTAWAYLGIVSGIAWDWTGDGMFIWWVGAFLILMGLGTAILNTIAGFREGPLADIDSRRTEWDGLTLKEMVCRIIRIIHREIPYAPIILALFLLIPLLWFGGLSMDTAVPIVLWLVMAGVLAALGFRVNRKTVREEERRALRRVNIKLEPEELGLPRLSPEVLGKLEQLYETAQHPHPGAVILWTLAALSVLDLLSFSMGWGAGVLNCLYLLFRMWWDPLARM